jgi:uncharacterized protein
VKPFIETFTGGTFAPLDPTWANIRVEDIAHALSNQGRFSGHTRFRYSVGEHSVRVSEVLEAWGCAPWIQLWGLLHDAAEAYLVDLPTPLKLDAAIGPAYRKAEAKLMLAVCKRFSLPAGEPAEVREADVRLLATEVRDLMHGDRDYWKKIEALPLVERIRPWGADVAEFEFLRRFKMLGGAK